MLKSSVVLAAVLAAGVVAGPAAAEEHWDHRWVPSAVDPARVLHAAGKWQLRSNATQTFTLRFPAAPAPRGKGNVLLPCYGFDVHGGGTDLAVANVPYFGPVSQVEGSTEPPDTPVAPDAPRRIGDGGVPGAQRMPDGTYAIPESVAVPGPAQDEAGRTCAAAGWHEYDQLGRPTNALLPPFARRPSAVADTELIEAPARATTTRAKAAARRKALAAARRRARSASRAKRLGVRPAQATQVPGAVTVELAGFTRVTAADPYAEQLVVRLRTGQLSGPAALRMRVDFLHYDSLSVPENR